MIAHAHLTALEKMITNIFIFRSRNREIVASERYEVGEGDRGIENDADPFRACKRALTMKRNRAAEIY